MLLLLHYNNKINVMRDGLKPNWWANLELNYHCILNLYELLILSGSLSKFI